MHQIIVDVATNLGLILAIIAIGEIIARTSGIAAPTMRKFMHILTAATVILGSLITDYHAFVIVGAIMTLGLFALRKITPLKSVTDRYNESQGEVYFALGVAITAYIAATPAIFITSITVLALADTAAFIVGRNVASPKLTATKSVAGTLACLIVSVIITLTFGHPLFISLVVGIYAAAAELLSTRGTDNATVPALCAALLSIGLFVGLS